MQFNAINCNLFARFKHAFLSLISSSFSGRTLHFLFLLAFCFCVLSEFRAWFKAKIKMKFARAFSSVRLFFSPSLMEFLCCCLSPVSNGQFEAWLHAMLLNFHDSVKWIKLLNWNDWGNGEIASREEKKIGKFSWLVPCFRPTKPL